MKKKKKTSPRQNNRDGSWNDTSNSTPRTIRTSIERWMRSKRSAKIQGEVRGETELERGAVRIDRNVRGD